jgi:N6-L-threonylcarbamoyladenine synthase
MHALYGGVVPEIASRKHVEVIAALTEQALQVAGVTRDDIDAVAVTYAPGLIGAVLVGLSFAKSVAWRLGRAADAGAPRPGAHRGQLSGLPELKPPFLALAISGGNTLIVDVRDYTDMKILGATRDDAAGECFDKAARVLGLPYPGGKAHGRSGAAVPGRRLQAAPCQGGRRGAGHELFRTENRRGKSGPSRRAEGRGAGPGGAGPGLHRGGQRHAGAPGHGGGPENRTDRHRRRPAAWPPIPSSAMTCSEACRRAGCQLYVPPLKLCGDNGAMIGAQAYYEYLAGNTAGMDLNAYATREIDG